MEHTIDESKAIHFVISLPVPKEITKDCQSGLEMASFGYYDGIDYCKKKGLKQSVYMSDVMKKTGFIVCCGDVMVTVDPGDFPDIPRRIL